MVPTVDVNRARRAHSELVSLLASFALALTVARFAFAHKQAARARAAAPAND